MKDNSIGFTAEGGVPAIRTADGKIDPDHRGREPGAGEKLIRLPRLICQCEPPDEDGGRNLFVINTGTVFDDLPIGTKLVFATFALADLRCPVPDGLTIILPNFATNLLAEFVPQDDNVTITPAEGLSLKVDPPWDSVTLTKTASAAWAASGDFAPA